MAAFSAPVPLRRRATALPLLVAGAAVALLTLPAARLFVGIGRSAVAPTAMARHASGFAAETSNPSALKKKPTQEYTMQPEALQKLHGENWEAVDNILRGNQAEKPSEILRARYTALVYKDAKFLAATCKQEGMQKREMFKKWTEVLGLTPKDPLKMAEQMFSGGDPAEQLRDPTRYEIVEEKGNEVEWKIFCSNGKVYHERLMFEPDPKWGFIIAGQDFGDFE
mmetsp:Transcript_56941/g.149156  ORF Transcript_56941/g.149156 Transcript_56941/m.149156 type:complete len:224 (-) Transcript_56941:97-768(-)